MHPNIIFGLSQSSLTLLGQKAYLVLMSDGEVTGKWDYYAGSVKQMWKGEDVIERMSNWRPRMPLADG